MNRKPIFYFHIFSMAFMALLVISLLVVGDFRQAGTWFIALGWCFIAFISEHLTNRGGRDDR